MLMPLCHQSQNQSLAYLPDHLDLPNPEFLEYPEYLEDLEGLLHPANLCYQLHHEDQLHPLGQWDPEEGQGSKFGLVRFQSVLLTLIHH